MEDGAVDPGNELELARLLPARVRRRDTLVAHRSFSLASFALALGTLIVGNGALSAAIAGMSVAAKNSITLGSALSFSDAFVLSLPLSLLVTGLVWLGSTERLNAVELAAFGVVGAIGITYLAGSVGIADPIMTEMLASAGSLGDNWFTQAFGIIGEYLTYYTWVPFLGGVITGFAMGWICAYLANPDRR